MVCPRVWADDCFGGSKRGVRITPETPFEFAARFVAHDGVLPPAVADQLQARFAAVTADELRSFLKA